MALAILFALIWSVPALTQPRYRISFTSFATANSDLFLSVPDGTDARPLMPHPASDFNGSFSPDGHWVVFTSTRAGSADLFRVHPDGSGLERLTDSPAFDDQARFSPDGNSLAFVSTRTGQADIWLLDLKTRKLVNLTNHAEGDFRPAWSPDGQWIAFSSDRDSTRPMSPSGAFSLLHSTEIYLMYRDGTRLRRITNGNAVAGSPAWSADSSSILFYESAIRGRSTQIISVDLATGKREELTSGDGIKLFPRGLRQGHAGYVLTGGDGGIRVTSGTEAAKGQFSSPQWSPDGKHIVFHREADSKPMVSVQDWFSNDSRFGLVRVGLLHPSYSPAGDRVVGSFGEGTATRGLFVLNANGANRKLIYEAQSGEVMGSSWSPRGDRIAFGVGAHFGRTESSSPKVATINPDGTDLKILTPSDRNDSMPSWAPDGKRLVCRSIAGARKGLSIVDTETGKITPLATGSEYDTFPAWSPRGDLISFTSKRDGDYEIYIIRPDGSGLRRLTNTRGADAHSAWSPDGEWIAFSTSRQGFKDEALLHPGNFQAYGEICVMRKDGSGVRVLTDNATEEGSVSWIPSLSK